MSRHLDRTQIEDIPLALLFVDASYQRDIRHSFVRHIATKFNPQAVGVIKVAKCGERFAIIDGQHRVEALRLMGAEFVRCEIVDAPGQREQADIHSDSNTAYKQTAVQRWHANVVAGRSPEAEITEWLASEGFYVTRASGGTRDTGIIDFPTTLLATWTANADAAKVALLIQRQLRTQRLSGNIHAGLCLCMNRKIDVGLYIEKINRMGGADEIHGRAAVYKRTGSSGGSVAKGYAQAILSIINHGKRNKIPWPE